MNKIVYTLTALLIFLSGAQPAFSQKYQPRDSWPYWNENFEEGTIFMFSGNEWTKGLANISVADGSLHYISNGTIMKADMSRVRNAVIGNFEYINSGGKMLRVLVKTESGDCALEEIILDRESLSRTDIGYGISSSTASSMNTSLVGLGLDGADGINIVNNTFSQVFEKRSQGQVLPLLNDFTIKVDGVSYPAGKKSVNSIPFVDKNDAKAFFKTTKGKWSDSSFLAKVMEFIEQQKNNNK